MDNVYKGHCHCGQVQFTVQTDLASPFNCNCSFCVRRAATLVKVDASKFSLLCDEAHLGEYGSRDFASHRFCTVCGIQCFTLLTATSQHSVAINTGCLEGVEHEAFNPVLFDGANKL